MDENSYMDVEDGITLKQLYRILKVPWLYRPILYCTINYEPARMKTRLMDGDVVSFLAPISGG